MAFMNPTPGVANLETVLEIDYASAATVTAGVIALSAGKIVVPALTKLTVNTSNGVYEWSQLDSRSKHVVATVSTNSIVTDVVMDRDAFFGLTSATAGSMAKAGIMKAQGDKTRLAFKVRIDSPAGDGTGDTISGYGYLTQLAPSVTADQPVWQTPITLVVDGEFTITAADSL
jgi:hypothetical protein